MRRVKQRIFCGAVCEQIIYNIGDSADIRTAKPRKPRFENEEDRAAHRECSRCKIMIPRTKEVPDQYWQYCPNCGARMDGGNEGE